MIELRGKYGTAKVFTDLVDAESIAQVTNLLNQEFVSGSRIRMMPDIHAGAGCTIGTTMEIYDKCCPNLVGVDIGCGMEVFALRADVTLDLEKLDRVIRERVPSGFNKRSSEHYYVKYAQLNELVCRDHVNLENARLSLGTLGGGNHFIEVDQADDGELFLVIHSGSRHLGLEVAKHYQNLAVDQLCGRDDDSAAKMIAELKAQGRQAEISDELKKLKSSTPKIPKELAYLTGQPLQDYLHDMKIVQEYAQLNRIAIGDEILRGMDESFSYSFTTIHNYIDTDSMILRKGAVSAKKGEKLLIPINMRDGSLICVGKGNPDWNYSAPHGAGRLMSRAKAKDTFTVEEFAQSMDGIYTTSVGRGTLDECPMAYKPMESILENIGDTVEVEKIIRPIYNFKASE